MRAVVLGKNSGEINQRRVRRSNRSGAWVCYNEALPSAPRLARRLFFVGEWLSLVEHLVRDQGVGGSNPLSPTNIYNEIQAISGMTPTAV
jgi:hypothetical protein